MSDAQGLKNNILAAEHYRDDYLAAQGFGADAGFTTSAGITDELSRVTDLLTDENMYESEAAYFAAKEQLATLLETVEFSSVEAIHQTVLDFEVLHNDAIVVEAIVADAEAALLVFFTDDGPGAGFNNSADIADELAHLSALEATAQTLEGSFAAAVDQFTSFLDSEGLTDPNAIGVEIARLGDLETQAIGLETAVRAVQDARDAFR